MVQQGLIGAADYGSKNDTFYEDYLDGDLDMAAYDEFSLARLTQYTVKATAFVLSMTRRTASSVFTYSKFIIVLIL